MCQALHASTTHSLRQPTTPIHVSKSNARLLRTQEDPFGGNLASCTSPLLVIRTHFKVERYDHAPSHLSSKIQFSASLRSGRSSIVSYSSQKLASHAYKSHLCTPFDQLQSSSVTDPPLYSQVCLVDAPFSLGPAPHHIAQRICFFSVKATHGFFEMSYVLINPCIADNSSGFWSLTRTAS